LEVGSLEHGAGSWEQCPTLNAQRPTKNGEVTGSTVVAAVLSGSGLKLTSKVKAAIWEMEDWSWERERGGRSEEVIGESVISER
jgi:hypothetical protein